MGGGIKVKSKLGLGTNIIVAFPTETCPETSPLDLNKSSMIIAKGLTGKKCLIVDDISENTYILEALLKNNGLEVHSCNRARNALALYKIELRVDFVITDLRMPEMSGQELIIDIREFERTHNLPRVPIIVLTAESALGERTACLTQHGADEYLLKPIKLQDLLNAIPNLVSIKKEDHKSKRPKNILLIDDDLIGAKIMQKCIMNSGDSVKICGTIQEAKEEFEKSHLKYNTIFLDSELPDGNGLRFMEFYQKLVEHGSARKIPVFSISGNPVEDQAKMYKDFPIRDFFQKPITKLTILNAIKSTK